MGGSLGSAAAALLVALTPALLRLWSGRSLARLTADPALPERLMASGRRANTAVGFTFVMLFFWPSYLAWTLPLLVLANAGAAYPLRKVLYEETWSFGTYLWFFTRRIVAAFGFWALLAATPAIVSLIPSRQWLVAAILAGVLEAWNARYSEIVRFALDARPVDDPALVSRFAAMVQTTGLAPPRFEQIPLGGGVFANAFAQPSLRRSAVLFTETLLARFDPDEIVAVAAHELAHLEHYNRRRLIRLRLVTHSLIVIAALAVPVAQLSPPAGATGAPYVWALGLLAAGMFIARRRQQHETASDLRAVALTGDAEAMIRALVKLHAIAHIPRRWTAQVERQATHPSLARRIQAIRAAAGHAPAALGEAARFAAAGDHPSSITFLDDHVEWTDAGAATRHLAYADLHELRVDARPRGAARLVVANKAGFRRALVLPSQEVARAQAVLDIVDGRIAAPLAPPAVARGLSRMLGVLTYIAANAVDQYAVMLAALLAIARPASPQLAAGGAAALAGALVTWRDRGLPAIGGAGDVVSWLGIALLITGLAMIGAARVNRDDETPGWMKALVATLAVCVSASWAATLAAAFLAGGRAVTVYQMAHAWPAIAVFPVALAGALLFRPSLRYASIPLVVAGLSAGFAGSTTFLDRFAHDPFVAVAEPLTVTELAGPPVAEFSVPIEVTGIAPSTDGRRLALVSEGTNERRVFSVGMVNGPLTPFDADDGLFIDESHVLLMDESSQGTRLREILVDTWSRVLWNTSVAGVRSAQLSYDPPSGRWRLDGHDPDGGVMRAEGRLGGATLDEQHWRGLPPQLEFAEPLATPGRTALLVDTTTDPRFLLMARWWPGSRWWQSMARLTDAFPWVETRLWTIGAEGEREIAASGLSVNCLGAKRSDERPVCAAFDGTRTGLFAVDADEQRLTPKGWLPGRFTPGDRSGLGWITGWLDGPVALRLSSREVIGPPSAALSRDDDPVRELAAADEVVVAVSWTRGSTTGSRIRVYARPIDDAHR